MSLHVHRVRSGIAWLELLLAISALVLACQLFPSLGSGLLWAIDVRNWSQEVWFALNAAVVLALLGVRFVPGLHSDWRQRRQRLTLEAAESAKRQQLKEQRETLKRVARGRKNRIY